MTEAICQTIRIPATIEAIGSVDERIRRSTTTMRARILGAAVRHRMTSAEGIFVAIKTVDI